MSSILLDDSKIKELDKRLTMVTNNQFLYYFKLIFIYNTLFRIQNTTGNYIPNSNYEIINSKIKDLGAHFEDLISQSNDKFKIIKENIKALSNQFEEDKLREEHNNEKKLNYMKILEQKINQRFDEERIKREDEESRIYNIINHRFTMLFNEINNEARNRLDSVDNLKLYLNSQNKENPDLNKNLIKERNARIDGDNDINDQINYEINSIENIISQEKKNREESEQKIMEFAKNSINKNKLELKKEQKNRKSAEENILSLIEDTINKINELDDYENIQEYENDN